MGGPETAVFVFDNGHNPIEDGLRIQEGQDYKEKLGQLGSRLPLLPREPAFDPFVCGRNCLIARSHDLDD